MGGVLSAAARALTSTSDGAAPMELTRDKGGHTGTAIRDPARLARGAAWWHASRRALHRASRNGSTQAVAQLLEAGAAVDSVDKCGRTPLARAAYDGHAEVVALLLAAGAKVDSISRHGWTPLFGACEMGHVGVVAQLLAAGAAVDGVTDGTDTPLHFACSHGRVEVVKQLLEAGASLGLTDGQGWTPLHCTCIQGDAQIAKMLLAAGADVNHGGGGPGQRKTPLHCACMNGRREVVPLLLAAGAVVDSVDELGRTPLHNASSCHLHWRLYASYTGSREAIVAQLLAAGANANSVDQRGRTPLHNACQTDCAWTVAQLLAAGADASRRDVDGLTPLAYACGLVPGLGDTATLTVAAATALLSAGTSAGAVSVDGGKAMQFALSIQSLRLVQLLSSHGIRYFTSTTSGVDHNLDLEGFPAQLSHLDGFAAIAEWITRSRGWTTRLHHLELLTEEQARAELRAGADLHSAAPDGGPTPLSIAHGLLAGADDAAPGAAADRLVLRAAEPWSPANHDLFPATARARAVELVRIGFKLSRESRFSGEGQAVMDLWREYIMKHAILRR